MTSSATQRRPFYASALDVAEQPVRLEGRLPEWLRGELLRTCPAQLEVGAWRAEHWFDGLCMLYGFRAADGKLSYRSRRLQSDEARNLEAGRVGASTFGTRTRRSLWRRLISPTPPVTDNCNVNVVQLGADRVALTEGPHQLILDENLGVRGRVAYQDELGNDLMSAHPQLDFGNQLVLNTLVHFGPAPWVGVYQHAPDQRRRRLIGKWRTQRVPYIHSFGLTPQKAVLVAHPFDVAPLRLLASNAGFIEPFRWRPEQGTKLIVIDRATGKSRTHVAEAMFVFHTAHAFDDGDDVVLDVVAHADAGVVARLSSVSLSGAPFALRGRVTRLRLRRGVERATVEPIGDVELEFPVSGGSRVWGRPSRWLWGASIGPRGADYGSEIVKLDLQSGATQRFSDDGVVYGEPIRVSRPGAAAEDDGVILTVGSSMTRDATTLAVLDAASLEVIARGEIDVAVPLGFHGGFFRE